MNEWMDGKIYASLTIPQKYQYIANTFTPIQIHVIFANVFENVFEINVNGIITVVEYPTTALSFRV